MIKRLNDMLQALRPAFSREATFAWFVIAFAGFVARTDNYGVSSIIRALMLAPACYQSLLHFFHSSAWTAGGLMAQWRSWLIRQELAHLSEDRIVLVGDHTKVVKDGRKMPEVETLHQDSETGSKPSFFRGHHWACLSLLIKAKNKFFGTPLWAEIHRESLGEKRTTRIVNQAGKIAEAFGYKAYLALDAFFAVGPVFLTAANFAGNLLVLTRAKKNVVAYLNPPPRGDAPGKGRPREYGEKLKLMELFDKWPDRFETADITLYDKIEKVRCLVLDLIWKPVKGKLRFILVESPRGRIILMTSDMQMSLQMSLTIYCHRVTVETLFDSLKNVLCGMAYHFWSCYLKSASRRPKRNSQQKQVSTRPDKTENTLAAIEKFVAVQMVVLGALQVLACKFGEEIHDKACCWLRTPCGEIPSVFVTKTALTNIIRGNIITIGKDWITRIILARQINVDKALEKDEDSEMAA
jgi:hypothetical protein